MPAHACCMCASGFILMHVHFNICAGIDCGNDSIGISIKFSSQVSCKAIVKYPLLQFRIFTRGSKNNNISNISSISSF